jgi:aryl-alcohol dehydrogenase
MSTTAARAAILDEVGGAFAVHDVEVAEPAAGEVLVKTVAAGICHTDLAVQSGALPMQLPGVLGHEGAGIVEAVGAGVTHVRPGDHVLLSFDSCGHCANCQSGHSAYCENFLDYNFKGSRPDGSPTITRDGQAVGGRFFGQSSFSTYALADSRAVVKVDSTAPLEILAPLGCGFMTGFATVMKSLAPQVGDAVAVFGTGPVGFAGLFAAKLSGATKIIAVDINQSRLDLAAKLGATHTINSKDTDLAEAVAEITGGKGLTSAFDTTGVPAVLKGAFGSLGLNGTLATVGVPKPGATVELDIYSLLFGRKVTGTTEGDATPSVYVPAMVDLYLQGRFPIDELVGTFAFEDVDKGVQAMHQGQVVKPVLVF